MSLLLVLALLVIGAMLGGAGLRRLGALTRRITGPWRPGVGVLSLICIIGALALAARGAELWAGLLILGGLGFALAARRRPRPKPEEAQGAGAMTRREAARILGVPIDAAPEAVEEAYRRLIRRIHPDLGGSEGLAAQLNAARAVMLG
jgi:hypothetical protein